MRVSAGFCVTGLSGKMLIHTLPPRRVRRVMAMRAASIWRAVIQPGSSAWMPYSPNASAVPPLDTPFRRPRVCLRCLTLRGINMVRSSVLVRAEVRGLVDLAGAAGDPLFLVEELLQLGVRLLDQGGGGLLHRGLHLLGTAPGARRHDPPRLALPGGLPDGHRRLAGDLVLGLRLVGEDVTLVDPDLDADAPRGGAGLPEAVVDVGSQRVPRHPAFAVPLGAAHLRAAEPTRALDADAEGAGLL